MSEYYEVRNVVCDYGVYENGELKLILNSRRFAEQIVMLLQEDERIHRELNMYRTINPVKDYSPYFEKLQPAPPKLVEVVRCKDCIHYVEMDGFEYFGRIGKICLCHCALRNENDYCSDGQRALQKEVE